MRTYLIFFLSLFAIAHGADIENVVKNPAEWVDKKITLRGFIYETNEGKILLSNRPGIKTCCVEKYASIEIKGDIPTNNKGFVTTVTGMFTEKEGHFFLEQALIQ